MIDITGLVRKHLMQSKIKDGMAIVYVPHTTAAVTINENADPDVKHDMLGKLSELVPKEEDYYKHSEGNSDSHVKTAMVGSSVTVLVENGELVLGTWQGIYFCEFDGPRMRHVLVKLAPFA
jgi:secondary thiamine-phosphate synthase enzyme